MLLFEYLNNISKGDIFHLFIPTLNLTFRPEKLPPLPPKNYVPSISEDFFEGIFFLIFWGLENISWGKMAHHLSPHPI